ncbi:hypothetical protein EQG49_08165 [Periweissella cryptocerci]|uniref:Uncharacterized protein n=1 Tax=Periweissella cryptocerci TaxID=2506420 RepID=A0A4P6YUI2_9LACO|nr:hypothetical protein [Periweissella cryptocerci]QBO36444.1 hypothetical protein EQG49_08165 [Periweissella cryptocerci]
MMMKTKKMITKMMLVLAVTIVALAPLQMVASQTNAAAATKTTKIKKAPKKVAKVKNSNHALKIVLKKVNPTKKTGIFYMVNKINKTSYQVEARKSSGGSTKLKGLYRLNTKTMKITQMNLNTGKFVTVK